MSVRISVVVPTFRRPRLLDRCLAALARQTCPPDTFEIVVADDGGDSATRAVVLRRGRAAGGPRVRYVRVSGRRGPAAARNQGWRAAAGEIIAFTDDDCVPDPDWLQQGVAAVRGHDAAWGRVLVPLPPEPTDFERDMARLAQAGFVTANCFCRRAALVAIGGLDENFTAPWREDSDLHFSLLERGFAVAQASRARVVHPVRRAPWGASLRQQRKILFDALLYKKHPALYRAWIRRAPRWDYYGILALLALAAGGAVSATPWLTWTAGAGWLAATAGFCLARLRRTSHRPLHVAEMAFTSALIPPLAVFWRLVGALRYRVMFF
jgi:glycosyltransferase involved in cell wall biosynthesis